MAPRPLPKQIQRIRQNSIESNSSNGSRGPRTASVRLISSTSSQLSDLPEDMVVGNDDVIDEAENNDATEHAAAIAATTMELCGMGCKTVPLDKCTYWTWLKTNSTCMFRGLLKVTGSDTDSMDAVTGEKYCTGESKNHNAWVIDL